MYFLFAVILDWPKSSFGFSVKSHRKTWTNFLINLVHVYRLSSCLHTCSIISCFSKATAFNSVSISSDIYFHVANIFILIFLEFFFSFLDIKYWVSIKEEKELAFFYTLSLKYLLLTLWDSCISINIFHGWIMQCNMALFSFFVQHV